MKPHTHQTLLFLGIYQFAVANLREPPLFWVGFVYASIILSIRHNAGIILIFLKHNSVVSENYEKFMQILPQLILECIIKL